MNRKIVIGRPQSRPSMKPTTLCPNCRNAIIKKDNFCRECGLQLDWSDYNGYTIESRLHRWN